METLAEGTRYLLSGSSTYNNNTRLYEEVAAVSVFLFETVCKDLFGGSLSLATTTTAGFACKGGPRRARACALYQCTIS